MHAEALAALALALMRQGNNMDALQASKQCLDISRELALIKPHVFKVDLATALNNHANRLAALGLTEDALAINEQSLSVYQELMLSDPEGVKHEMATALGNFANFSDDLGYSEEALKAAKKALAIYQEFPEPKSKKLMYDMAVSLSNQATYLVGMGLAEDAVKVSRQGLKIAFDLEKNKPERYRPMLASSIANHIVHLAAYGEFEEAASKANDVFTIFMDLSKYKLERYKFEQENARIMVFFWSWLASGILTAPLLNDGVPEIGDERKQRSLNFSHFFVVACLTGSQEAVQCALVQWGTLDVSQRQSHKGAFFIMAAASEQNNSPSESAVNWREEFKCYRDQCQGRLPAWLVEVARRRGLVL
ncbi:hypothetical protein TR67_00585 [Pseudomonas deceptionensis]|nr:hypothetical protein TR67_00585 [Pseudomonas deceptionensis]